VHQQQELHGLTPVSGTLSTGGRSRPRHFDIRLERNFRPELWHRCQNRAERSDRREWFGLLVLVLPTLLVMTARTHRVRRVRGTGGKLAEGVSAGHRS
jgi:hypothetical protein